MVSPSLALACLGVLFEGGMEDAVMVLPQASSPWNKSFLRLLH